MTCTDVDASNASMDLLRAPSNGVPSSPIIEYSTMYNGALGGGGGDLGSVANWHTICSGA